MIRTVYNEVDLFILNDAPNWMLGYGADFYLTAVDFQASLSQRETRRPYSSTVLTNLSFTVHVSDSALNQLVGCLKQLKDQPVLAPFWPAVSFFKDFRKMVVTGGLMVAFKKDWSQWELYLLGQEPAWVLPGDLVCPVVYGFVDPKSTFKWVNTTNARWQVKLSESSKFDYALNFQGIAPNAGPIPDPGYGGEAPMLLPFQQDHRATQETFNVIVRRDSVGFSREQAATFYPHEVFRGQTSQYVLRGLQELADYIGFYQGWAAAGASFWVRSPFRACMVAQDSISTFLSGAGGDDLFGAGGDEIVTSGGLIQGIQILVIDATQLVGGEWLVARVGGVDYFAQVKNVVGNTLTLHEPFGIDLPAFFPLYPLTLSKCVDAKTSVRFASPVLSIGKLTHAEVKPEETLPIGEVPGETIGQMPTKVYLFHFWRDYGNGAIDNWYFTSFECNVQYAGAEYISANFNIGDMVSGVNLQDDSTDIMSFIFEGNPLNDEAALISETLLQVEIFTGELKI